MKKLIVLVILFIPSILNAQNEKEIIRLNTYIKEHGMEWIAGETSVSRMSDEDKKMLFGGEIPDDLNGFEYYKGGIFQIEPKEIDNSGGGTLINHFDWRDRHGVNWITPVKNQGPCGSCWAFSVVGITEILTNLYFNQHLDLDLSEQNVLSCSAAGNCEGGSANIAFEYIQDVGVFEEECFEYAASDLLCNEQCPEPVELIKINGITAINSYAGDNIKQMLINHGPLHFGIVSWWHYMVLVGYETDEIGTIWILKNSWGTDWGEDGYVRMRVDLTDIYALYFVEIPVVSKIPTDIACVDSDGDGYYTWGISANKPASCPDDALPEQDCDDSDATIGAMDSDGNCIEIPEPIPEPEPEPVPEPEPEPIPEPIPVPVPPEPVVPVPEPIIPEPEPPVEPIPPEPELPEPEPKPPIIDPIIPPINVPVDEPEIPIRSKKHSGDGSGCFIGAILEGRK